jgi:hypothetical protein
MEARNGSTDCLVVLVLLAIPLLLVVALVMIAGLRRRVAALEAPWPPRLPRRPHAPA